VAFAHFKERKRKIHVERLAPSHFAMHQKSPHHISVDITHVGKDFMLHKKPLMYLARPCNLSQLHYLMEVDEKDILLVVLTSHIWIQEDSSLIKEKLLPTALRGMSTIYLLKKFR